MKVIPPFQLTPEPLDDAAREMPPFKWAPKPIGRRHQLGGSPDFIQGDEWPTCKTRRVKMTFYGQLDSINDEICIADCGMIYVFLCFGCFESESFVQSN
ncbi:DUF1963 domain-containing protein [Bradyrhizobium sp. HKCCYLS2038]|uniref:DUF1963 domain-containing protein n=1 Tax=unclassified Bradyrhizobium TaxID=2631580 RepID=UPI003EBCCD76